MSKLSNMLSIWEDPESVYDKWVSGGRVTNRLDFLKVAVGYDNQDSKATHIRGILNSEMSIYSKEEQEACIDFLDTIDAMYSQIVLSEKSGVPLEIIDLRLFYEMCASVNNSETEEIEENINEGSKSLSISDYSLMTDGIYCSMKEVMLNGFLCNAVTYRNGEIQTFRIDPFDEDVKIFSCPEGLITFLQGYSYKEDNSFLDKVYAISMYLLLNNVKIKYPLIFGSPNLFEVTEKGIMLEHYDSNGEIIKEPYNSCSVNKSVSFKIKGEVKKVPINFQTKKCATGSNVKFYFVK